MKTRKTLQTISILTILSLLCYTLPVMAYTKEETVYSKTDSKGNSYETIVTSHIKNTELLDTIKDVSDLLDIENTNGYETFEKDGNTLVWNANGNDIYYKGKSEKQLPITCNISYELNGEEISADEIAGKSGKIKVKLDYSNNEEHTVLINGRNETIYTPFVVIAGTVFNNETNKNITISTGKLVDNGTKTIAVGMAFPGMGESLGISKNDFEIPESIEIEMDSTDFELDTIASFVTPKLIESKEDLDKINKLDEIYEKITTLQDASNQILDGANTLKQGTEEYSAKSQEFNTAMKQVSQGMSNANQSYTDINDGISTLNSSSKTLSNGAKQVSDGTKQVSDNLGLISSKLQDAENGSKQLEAGEKQLSQGIDQILGSLGDNSDGAKKLQELKTLIAQNENTISTLTTTNKQLNAQKSELSSNNSPSASAQLAQLNAQIQANESMIKLLTANNSALNETLKSLSATSELKAGIENLKDGVDALQVGNKALTDGITSLKEGASTLASKSSELSTGANSLYTGTQSLCDGTQKMSQGSVQMKSGLNTLDSSILQLSSADDQLTEGANTIHAGANSLYEGILQLNEQGISPICNTINGKLKNITNRVKKLGELSLNYDTYSMLSDGEKGNVQFIILSDGIKRRQ